MQSYYNFYYNHALPKGFYKMGKKSFLFGRDRITVTWARYKGRQYWYNHNTKEWIEHGDIKDYC